MENTNFERSRVATEITLGKISSWEGLNAITLEEGDKRFSEATRKLWKDFAVSGILQFDPETKQRTLCPFTDLDGRSALGVLKLAGIDTTNVKYVRPGEYLQGAINLDTGDKFGVVYEEPTYTTWFDHHAPGSKEVTSTTELVYQTMIELDMIQKSPELDRLVKFVTDVDNRRILAIEFTKSGRTLLGLAQSPSLTTERLLAYFRDHETPTEELTSEQFEKYGLRKETETQQKVVDDSMRKLEDMEREGKVVSTRYGSVVINVNNELKVGSSAAYVRHDGILNFTPEKSFALTFKDKQINETELRERLGEKFQGKIIRNTMWIYNDKEPLGLTLEEVIDAIK